MIGVYAIVHSPSGRRYVGHSINVGTRLHVHRCLLRQSKHHCIHLQRAWDKYGESAFDFVTVIECATQSDAFAAEQALLDAEFSTGRLFNSLAVNQPLAALNAARALARTPDAIKRRVESTRASGRYCAGQRTPVYSIRVADGAVDHFPSLAEAARTRGVSRGNVHGCCVGERVRVGGYSYGYGAL